MSRIALHCDHRASAAGLVTSDAPAPSAGKHVMGWRFRSSPRTTHIPTTLDFDRSTLRNVSCHNFEIIAAKRRSCEALIAPLKSRSVKVANQPSVCTGF